MASGGHGHSHGGNNNKSVNSHGHSHDANSHGHSHGGGGKFLGLCFCSDTVRLGCMLCMTFSFFIIELIVGQISHSISLTADSFHMLSDALALVIGLVTAVISKKTSKKNTYGWVRAEVLGPLINSVFLVSLCLGIVIEALERLFEPQTLKDINLLLYVGTIGLLINLAGLFLFGHGHSHSVSHDLDQEMNDDSDSDDDDDDDDDDDASEIIKIIEKAEHETDMPERNPFIEEKKLKQVKIETIKAKPKKKCCAILSKEANMNMRAVFIHVMADALGSVIVIISALLNKFQDELHVPKKLIDYIDPILCLCLVTLILSTALPLMKESCLILLQTVPKDIEVHKLKTELLAKFPNIYNVHELHIWKLTGRKIIATAHVTCLNSVEYMQIAVSIKEFFYKKGIHSTTIQLEFIDLVEGRPMTDDCMIECLSKLVKNKSFASQLKNIHSNEPSQNHVVVPIDADNSNTTV